MDDADCQFNIWWSVDCPSMYAGEHVAEGRGGGALVSAPERSTEARAGETQAGRKIIPDRLEFYDYYRPPLNSQRATESFRIKFLISLTAPIAFCCFLFCSFLQPRPGPTRERLPESIWIFYGTEVASGRRGLWLNRFSRSPRLTRWAGIYVVEMAFE